MAFENTALAEKESTMEKQASNGDLTRDEVSLSEAQNGSPIDPVLERKLLNKIDRWLLPIFGLLYLFTFLDRSSIGNAQTAGMSKSLGLVGNQYGAAVSVVYSTYVVFEPIYANLLKIITPRILMGGSILAFGTLTVCTAYAGSYHGLLAIRVLLGVAEAGVFPSIVTYFAMTYRREELGVRLSYIFACAALSGAFGGIMSFALSHIHTSALEGWQAIFVVEGALSLGLAPIVFFWVPSRIDRAFFLNEDEKALCRLRYEHNLRFYNPNDKFEWKYARAAALDWLTWTSGVIQFSADIALYGISTFLPVFIKGMGFTAYNAQLLTVPVYVLGLISFLIQGRLSDRYRKRGVFIFFGFVCQLVGYIILGAAKPTAARYTACFIVALGLYIPTGLNIGWVQSNSTPHYKRATTVGLMQLVGNSAGAAIGSIFATPDAPYFFTGFYVAIGLCALAMAVVAAQIVVLRVINRRRAKQVADGAPDQPELGNKNPHFVYVE